MLLASFAVAATAVVPTTQEFSTGSTNTDGAGASGAYGWFPSGIEACAAYAKAMTAVFNVAESAGSATGFSGVLPGVTRGCAYRIDRGANGVYNGTAGAHARSGVCPANSTAVSGGCQCNAEFMESGGQCVPKVNQCTPNAGKVQVTNWTVAFFRTPDDNDYSAVGPVNKLPPGGTFCSGGCTMNIPDPGAPGWAAWRSQAPNAQGLYRGSLDIPAVNSGQECTPGTGDAPLSPTAVEPQCPGAVGEVNGKKGCYGTAQNPVTTTPTDRPPVPPIAGNPSAGPKPATGDGSGTGSAGRTPAAGDGGNAGGPAAAGVGGRGGSAGGTATGTGSSGSGDGEKPDPCGAPGQAQCNVKVDETGTPAGAGTTFDGAKKAVDDSVADTIEKINQARDRTDGPKWTFSFALPSGCSPYPIGIAEFTLDVCQYQPIIHDLLSMVWAAVTAFTIIGMVGRTIRGT